MGCEHNIPMMQSQMQNHKGKALQWEAAKPLQIGAPSQWDQSVYSMEHRRAVQPFLDCVACDVSQEMTDSQTSCSKLWFLYPFLVLIYVRIDLCDF